MSGTVPFSQEDMSAFEESAKIGLVATVDPQGLPHVSLITSIQAKPPDQLMFGQFSEGQSKRHVKSNPHVGFLVMSRDKELWRGKARWTGEATSGDDYEMYNRKPMFRYNSYFGIHTVHYLDLVEFSGKESLSTAGVAIGSLVTALARRLLAVGKPETILKPWAEKHVTKLGTLKFLSYVGGDGYPAIIPVVPCQAAGSTRLVFAPTVHRGELAAIPTSATVAVFALNLQMESVLIRGRFTGYRRYAGLRAGGIDVDWVYNSMPPMQGTIYPVPPVPPVPSSDRSA
jgi:uncharacterized pyridoxamine 5'-phosphate oxidase family protein